MEAAYLQAAFPKRRKVLGQVLEPLSLGHVHLLQHRGNSFSPFFEGSAEPLALRPFDLIEAAFICVHTYPEALEALASPWLAWKIWLWGKLCRRIDIAAECASMREYISEQSQFPKFWRKQSDSSVPGAPLLQIIRLTHLQHLHCSHADCMTKPFGLAQWDYCAYWEMKGSIDLVNGSDLALIEAARLMQEEAVESVGNPS